MARVIIEHNGKRYTPYIVKNCMCEKRTCDLYDKKRCDGYDNMPCDSLYDAIDRAGLQNAYGVNFKEVKNG